MSGLSDAWVALVADLTEQLSATSIKLADDMGASIEGGQAVLGPPTFLFEGMCDGDAPTGISYTVFLTEAVGERAIERLLARLPELIEALVLMNLDTVIEAPIVPGAFPTGSSELPSYAINAETTF